MKLGKKLVLYYLTAALASMLLVGFAVVKGVEYTGIASVEKQLIEKSEFAQIYINQNISLQKNYDAELKPELARQITGYLSSSLGELHIYDLEFQQLSSSVDVKDNQAGSEQYRFEVLRNAMEGNYSYVLHNNTIYFGAPIEFNSKIVGMLEIVYQLGFLNEILNSITKILFIGVLAFCILITILSIYISGKVLKPIKRLAVLVDRYSGRDFQPVRIESNDEVGMLCKGFNAMGIKLQDYLQRQKQFVANVSHELRTPLTAIKGYSEYLSEEIKGNPDQERAVYHLNNESARLTKLVDELLLLSRIDSSREVFDLKRIDLSQVVSEAINKLKFKEQRCQVKIDTEIEAGINVCADFEKLVQVIINILDNAIKFSSMGSNIKVKLTKNEELSVLEVADNGIGIPEDGISKIFDRFYRAGNAGNFSGTGLGLAISKEIVELLNGTISVKSELDKGTTVTVKLPLWKEVLS